MSAAGKKILFKYKTRWQQMLWLKVFLWAVGPAILLFFITKNIIWSLLVFTLLMFIISLVIKPWEITATQASTYIDTRLREMEYSSGLILIPESQLSGLARLQQEKVTQRLQGEKTGLKPAVEFRSSLIIATMFVLSGVLLSYFGVFNQINFQRDTIPQEEIISFKPVDSVKTEIVPPKIIDQKLQIRYPGYTNIGTIQSSKMDFKALKGSLVTWNIKFNGKIDSAKMESMGNRYPMALKEGSYSRSSVLNASGFYNFRFTDTLGNSYASDLYSIEIVEDQSPSIEIKNLQQFASFEVEDSKKFKFNTLISDDYGIADAYIVATVSKGTGESVKFREEKLNFASGLKKGSKILNLSKTIDLDQLKMEPGDELYFYVEALDFMEPKANYARSETYFAVIKDTTTASFGVEGGMAADLMPDYFRSQRQLIIDTEKLISERGELPKKEFNITSNELGFDQKALRLKYGQFMGDEAEGGLAINETQETPETHDEEAEDPLAEYTHDHDGDNEHNLVPAEEEEEETEAKNPLADYVHNHDDPEESTLFSNSLKAKLRQALNIMWDAELYLRLYEPEKSLPFQYKALALIQEIKNSARIYVHRIGFDPPPIKEDVRLTGELDEVSGYQKLENLEKPAQYPFMRKAIERLEEIQANRLNSTRLDQEIFEQAGVELAAKAIDEPGNYLKTLQQLKWLSENVKTDFKEMRAVQRGLLEALPNPDASPGKNAVYSNKLNTLLLKELEADDR